MPKLGHYVTRIVTEKPLKKQPLTLKAAHKKGDDNDLRVPAKDSLEFEPASD